MPQSKSRKKTGYTPPPQSNAPKVNPPWLVPTMVTLLVVGLVWVVVTYMLGARGPIPGIGQWNLAVGFLFMIGGLGLTTRWH